MVTPKPVRQPVKEGRSLGRAGERGSKVLGYLRPPGRGVDGKLDADRIACGQTRRLTDSRAHTDQAFARHDRDGRAEGGTVEADRDGGPLAGAELLDDLGGNDD